MAEDDDKQETAETATDADLIEADIDDSNIEHIEHDDEPHLAGRVLTALGFIVAGAALALWIGPKIAPSLPAGMAPVAQWLAPGGAQNQEQIDQLRAEFLDQIQDLPTNLTTTQIENIVVGRLANVEGRLVARINELNTQFVAYDPTDLESRLAALETKTEGIRAELKSLTDQLSMISEAGGEISADTSERIATYGAALDGLKAEIQMLAAQNGELSQRLEEATRVAEQQVSDAETKANEIEAAAEIERRAAQVESAFKSLETAFSVGGPFDQPLSQLSDAGYDVPIALADMSAGVRTIPQLRNSFPEAAHDALRSSVLTENQGGVVGSVSTFFKAQVVTRSLTPQEGGSVDAILSRAEAALKEDDIAGALSELDALPDGVATAGDGSLMGVWLTAAKSRFAAETALQDIVASYEGAQ